MPIPAMEEFESWLSFAAAPVESIARLPDGPLTVDDIAAFLREVDEDRGRAYKALVEMTPARWLTGQREYQRARDRVFAKRRKAAEAARAADPERFRRQAERLLDSIMQLRPVATTQAEIDRERDQRLRWQIDQLANAPWDRTWMYGTMHAVAEYLERTNASRLADAHRELAAAAQAAQAAVARYVELAEEVNRAKLPRGGIALGRFKSRFAPRFDIPEWPIGRKDERSAERLFVYRMFFVNRRFARSPKAEAIAELMGLEGFRHQYDVRSIERQCASFSNQERQYWRAVELHRPVRTAEARQHARAAGAGSKG